ncbi:MAG: amidohydrolase [Bacillota bacterium]
MEEEDFEQGYLLIDNGKIISIGKGGDTFPIGTEIIDLTGMTVMPGLIDPHCHLGIYEEIYRVEGNDANEYSDPITPELRALDAINPTDQGFLDALEGGVTTVGICPGSANVVGGSCAVLKTFGKTIDEMVIKETAGLKIAFGENPKRVYGEQKKKPVTRMAVAALLRNQLVKARHYLNGKEEKDDFEPDLGLEQIGLVLENKIPLRAHAHRSDDILTALRIAKEFQVPIIIEHCTEGHLIVDELKESQVSVVVGPSLTSRAKVEMKNRSFATAGILAEAGIKVALCTDHPETPIQYLFLCGALAVKEGMKEKDALRAITINGAEVLGIADRVGSLKPGKDADLIILDGSIFDLKTKITAVYINGEKVESRK